MHNVTPMQIAAFAAAIVAAMVEQYMQIVLGG